MVRLFNKEKTFFNLVKKFVCLGDTVEENADLVVRLLIRRPDCLGPALRGEGGGLLKAIREGIAQSLYIARRQNADDPVIQAAYQEIIDDESMHNLNEE